MKMARKTVIIIAVLALAACVTTAHDPVAPGMGALGIQLQLWKASEHILDLFPGPFNTVSLKVYLVRVPEGGDPLSQDELITMQYNARDAFRVNLEPGRYHAVAPDGHALDGRRQALRQVRDGAQSGASVRARRTAG